MYKKRILTLLIGFAGTISLIAQPFTTFAEKDFSPGTVFSTQFNLGKNYADSVWSVNLIYPEFRLATKSETELLKEKGIPAQELPAVETSLSISRKQGFLDVYFTPFAYRNGHWMRMAGCKIQLVANPRIIARKAQALPNLIQRYTDHSVLSKGKWVKISVPEEGIYQLTASKLKSWGFNNINRVKIYGYGGRILPQKLEFSGDNSVIDDLCEVATWRRSNSLLFYAEGTLRWSWDATKRAWNRAQNTYSRASYYFITEGESPLEMKVIEPTTASTTTLTSAIVPALHEKDAFAWYEGGTEFFSSYDFINKNTQSFTLSTPGFSGGTAKVAVAVSAASTLKNTNVETLANSLNLGTFSISTYDSETESARETRALFSTDSLLENNTFKITTTAGNSARLNYILASYPRKLDASVPFVFTPATMSPSAAVIRAENATASTQLWRIASASAPTAIIKTTINGTKITAQIEDAKQRYIFVDVAKNYAEPSRVGTIENQDLHADSAQDMVIIIPESGKLKKQAERLAMAHRAEGLRVKIVRADQLYNEFSSGTPDATAYRRYLKMLYDRAKTTADMPRYLLLFGNCYWDNRLLLGSSFSTKDLLLAFEVSPNDRLINIPHGTLYSYVTDDYYGLLDDGEGSAIASRDKVDLGIGRFICTTEEEAKILVDKTLEYMENKNVGAWKNRVIMLADNGDNNLHQEDCETTVRNIQNANDELIIKKYYWDAYPMTTSATGNSFPQVTRMLQEELKRGALIFNYTGHGSPRQLSHNKLLQTSDFEKITDGNMPLWIFASCEITPYDQQMEDIGRATLFNTKQGSVAIVCATRSVYAIYNRALNAAYSRYVLSSDGNGKPYTLGDAMRLAKVSLVTNAGDRSMNKLKYALLGDPALTLTAPRGQVVVDSIDREAITSSTNIQLKAGQKVRFAGHVERNGLLATDFNGTVTGSLYDRLENIICKNNNNANKTAMVYQDRKNALFEGSDSIRFGRFQLNVVVPRDISYSEDKGRMYFYAVNTDHSEESHGSTTQFHLNGTIQTQKTDTLGPKVFVYLNSTDFPDGGYVSTAALFGATLHDISGINANGLGVGHNIELSIDGDVNNIIVLNDYFAYDFGSTTSGTIQYPLTNLSPGRHKLTLRVWDVNDNSTTTSLNFFVSEDLTGGYDVNATANPAYTTTTFVTTLENSNEKTDVSVEVYDIAGRRIWNETSSTSANARYDAIRWSLTDYANRPVPAGIYIYRSIISSSSKRVTTKSKKMIIVRQ
ncbi:type IX secretion system sortase PorU [uncultured Alloprevotella sp.]|jgi:hypothetical protein|uniref:type IX secretion system sortase PorU n=1 Tax=uncultured Alloprevotella sp. TaxID=1283315 RepID=UPI00325FD805